MLVLKTEHSLSRLGVFRIAKMVGILDSCCVSMRRVYFLPIFVLSKSVISYNLIEICKRENAISLCNLYCSNAIERLDSEGKIGGDLM